MKKMLFIAAIAAMVLGATAANKPKKGDADAVTAATAKAGSNKAVKLVTSNDSLSYAAGYAQTNGLIPYLQDQLGVDTAYMADFIAGLSEAKEKANDPRYKARAAGAQISQMIEDRMLKGMNKELEGTGSNVSRDLFYNGFLASLNGDTAHFNMQKATEQFQSKFEAAAKVKAELKKKENEARKVENEAWLKDNKNKNGVVTTESGLQYKVITMGTGERPTADKEVEVKYEGKLIDGTVFDSSYKRNPQTTKFKCNQVIKGWTEGLQLMPVGSKFEFYIPQELGYGESGNRGIPPYSTLIFTVELVGIK